MWIKVVALQSYFPITRCNLHIALSQCLFVSLLYFYAYIQVKATFLSASLCIGEYCLKKWQALLYKSEVFRSFSKICWNNSFSINRKSKELGNFSNHCSICNHLHIIKYLAIYSHILQLINIQNIFILNVLKVKICLIINWTSNSHYHL